LGGGDLGQVAAGDNCAKVDNFLHHFVIFLRVKKIDNDALDSFTVPLMNKKKIVFIWSLCFAVSVGLLKAEEVAAQTEELDHVVIKT
jgi:hypothetical protein